MRVRRCSSQAMAALSRKIGLTDVTDLKTIATIDFLRAKSLDASDMALIAAQVASNSSVAFLDLAGNGFGAKGAEHLSSILRACQALEHLSLEANNLRAGVADFADALAEHPKLSNLSLAANAIPPSACEALATALARNASLGTVSFASNAFGPDGAAALANGLERAGERSTIRSLSFVACAVRAQGARSIAEVLVDDGLPLLSSLNMHQNFIGDDGATTFASMLRRNTSLREVTLSDNGIREAGVQALAEALHENTTLERLDLRLNGLNAAAKALLVHAKARAEEARGDRAPLELQL
jgi:Ran GTPase-activating protein (RanGAP) involved in mRNA processing and transport